MNFDEYAADYDSALDKGIAVSGENKEYFSTARIAWLWQCLQQSGEHPTRIMDFGCGTGSASQGLLQFASRGFVVGVDVSKKQLDVALLPGNEAFAEVNDEAGIKAVVERLLGIRPDLVVMEATGGYETACATAVSAAGFRTAVVNPRQVRAFARATGQLAKTDRIDARVLAHFGAAIDPQVTPMADEQTRELQAMLVRRGQLVAMRTQEKNRLAMAVGAVRQPIKEHVAWLDKAQRAGLDADSIEALFMTTFRKATEVTP